MSEEGGLEEFEEFFDRRATCSVRRATWAVSSETCSGQAGVLLTKRRVLPAKFGVFGFKSRDPSQVELFPGRFHPSTLLLTSRSFRAWWLPVLSDVGGPPLEPEKNLEGLNGYNE